MLPHATIMACSQKKKTDSATMTWRKKVKALAAKRQRTLTNSETKDTSKAL